MLQIGISLAIGVTLASLAGPRIVVDPGHGGEQVGAVSDGGRKEKVLALSLARKLKRQLEQQFGATVVLTRDDDVQVTLGDRVALARAATADLFISLHLNSMPIGPQRQSTEGVETFFLSASASGESASRTAAMENAEAHGRGRRASDNVLAFILADLQRASAHADSSRLAHAIHAELVRGTGAFDRGVQQAPFYVLMGVDVPAVLLEVGFLSNPAEAERLSQAAYQQRVVEAIADGVAAFFARTRGEEGESREKDGGTAAPVPQSGGAAVDRAAIDGGV